MNDINTLRKSLAPHPAPAWARWLWAHAAYILGTLMLMEAAFIFGLAVGFFARMAR